MRFVHALCKGWQGVRVICKDIMRGSSVHVEFRGFFVVKAVDKFQTEHRTSFLGHFRVEGLRAWGLGLRALG